MNIKVTSKSRGTLSVRRRINIKKIIIRRKHVILGIITMYVIRRFTLRGVSKLQRLCQHHSLSYLSETSFIRGFFFQLHTTLCIYLPNCGAAAGQISHAVPNWKMLTNKNNKFVRDRSILHVSKMKLKPCLTRFYDNAISIIHKQIIQNHWSGKTLLMAN